MFKFPIQVSDIIRLDVARIENYVLGRTGFALEAKFSRILFRAAIRPDAQLYLRRRRFWGRMF
jgi:hypothetical protein